MLPGMVSGYLADHLGYHQFFILVMAFCLITFIVAALIKIDPSFGKSAVPKEKTDE
jgi:PAT family beta-lactamase induction signal transducer AmpG